MVMVVGTIQIGNPVGQPQIIPVSGDLQQNMKPRWFYKKLRVQTYLQCLVQFLQCSKSGMISKMF